MQLHTQCMSQEKDNLPPLLQMQRGIQHFVERSEYLVSTTLIPVASFQLQILASRANNKANQEGEKYSHSWYGGHVVASWGKKGEIFLEAKIRQPAIDNLQVREAWKYRIIVFLRRWRRQSVFLLVPGSVISQCSQCILQHVFIGQKLGRGEILIKTFTRNQN